MLSNPETTPVQVTSRKRTYKTNSIDLLHAYLLTFSADLHRMEPSCHTALSQPLASVPLWTCLLAAVVVAVVQQVGSQSQPLLLSCRLQSGNSRQATAWSA